MGTWPGCTWFTPEQGDLGQMCARQSHLLLAGGPCPLLPHAYLLLKKKLSCPLVEFKPAVFWGQLESFHLFFSESLDLGPDSWKISISLHFLR